LGDRSVFYAFDHSVYNKDGHEEPFARSDRIAKAVFDFNVQPRGRKHAMNDVLGSTRQSAQKPDWVSGSSLKLAPIVFALISGLSIAVGAGLRVSLSGLVNDAVD
jgi:hypothetical protein